MRDKKLMRIVLISMTILLLEKGIDILIRKGFAIDLNKWFTLLGRDCFSGDICRRCAALEAYPG